MTGPSATGSPRTRGPSVAVIDYGAGNVRSAKRGFDAAGGEDVADAVEAEAGVGGADVHALAVYSLRLSGPGAALSATATTLAERSCVK